MSQENDKKPDEFDFDMNTTDQPGGNPFSDENYNPFAEDAFSFGDNASAPSGDNVSGDNAGNFDFSSFGDAPPGFSNESAGSSVLPDSTPLDDLPAPPPSSFLSDNDAPAEGESDTPDMTVGPLATDPKAKKKGKEKKAKPEKKPKEKTPKEKGVSQPVGTGGVFSLTLAVVLLLGLIGFNVWTVLSPPEGVGMTSTIIYLIAVDIVGLLGVAVPFLFYTGRNMKEKPETQTEAENQLDVFKVILGTSVMALALGIILLLTPLYRYDFSTKAGPGTGMASRPAATSAPAPAPVPAPPAAEPAAPTAPAETTEAPAE